MWHGADGAGWWMLWGGLMMFVFWGGIIALIVWAIQVLTRRESGQTGSVGLGSPPRAPLDSAKERYARGEINRDEFLQIRKDLEGS
jgi:putative membrane protein